MKDKFYVGQRCELHNPGNKWHRVRCTIIEPLHDAECVAPGFQRGTWKRVYSVDVDGAPTPPPISTMFKGYAMPEEHLRPIYDGDQKTAWSESSWVPIHMRKFAVTKEKRSVVEPEETPAK